MVMVMVMVGGSGGGDVSGDHFRSGTPSPSLPATTAFLAFPLPPSPLAIYCIYRQSGSLHV